MMAFGVQMLLCLVALAALPSDWLLPVAVAQDDPPDPTGAPDPEATPAGAPDPVATPAGAPDPEATPAGAPDPEATPADASGPAPTPGECREEQFPCTRLYSVHKPVKQCISYLCVTSIRRTYMINKEICSRIVCKEDEAMQEELCRQLAGLPPRRLRRSNRPRGPLCRLTQDQHPNGIKAQ